MGERVAPSPALEVEAKERGALGFTTDFEPKFVSINIKLSVNLNKNQ